jgi:hypothetical protein
MRNFKLRLFAVAALGQATLAPAYAYTSEEVKLATALSVYEEKCETLPSDLGGFVEAVKDAQGLNAQALYDATSWEKANHEDFCNAMIAVVGSRLERMLKRR